MDFNRASEVMHMMLGPRFIEVEEIIHVNEGSEGEDNNEREELMRRLRQVRTRYRQERELHDYMFQHGQALEELINETTAENKFLTRKMKKFQQQMADIRKVWEKEDEEALHQQFLSEKKSIKSQQTYIRKKEKQNEKLRKRNEELTAELDRLSVGDRHQEQIQNLKTAEQMYKDLTQLRQERRELREALIRKQEQQILAARSRNESKTLGEQRAPEDSSAADTDEETHKNQRSPTTGSWLNSCAKALWRGVQVAGVITLCVFLSLCLVLHMTSDCISPDPECCLWNIAFALLL